MPGLYPPLCCPDGGCPGLTEVYRDSTFYRTLPPGVGLIVSILCPVRRVLLVLEPDSCSPVSKVCHFDTLSKCSMGHFYFFSIVATCALSPLVLAILVENGDSSFFFFLSLLLGTNFIARVIDGSFCLEGTANILFKAK